MKMQPQMTPTPEPSGRSLRRRLQVVLLTIAATAVSAPAAGAAEPQPTIEVAPGVYLASFSEFGKPPASPEESPKEARRRPDRPQASPSITGGHDTKISRWPWQVSIAYKPLLELAPGGHNCGGSLVAPDIVVTAAHCMNLGGADFTIPPDQFQVATGRTRLKSKQGAVHQLRDYYWFVDGDGNPLWSRERISWDVAFMQLEDPSPQKTIKIAGADELAVWLPGQRAFVTGWGLTDVGTDDEIEGVPHNVLKQARIRMISSSACNAVYGDQLLADLMVCAGLPKGGRDACSGDSGGPLVVPVAGGEHRLVGDVSFASGCGLPGVPGVYGRLAGDPIRAALSTGIESVGGVNVVGSGAEPPARFRFGSRSLRYGRGAHLALKVPGAGEIRLARTRKLRSAEAHPRHAGRVRVRISARGRTRQSLSGVRKGEQLRRRARAQVTFYPLHGGDEKTRSVRLRLVRKR